MDEQIKKDLNKACRNMRKAISSIDFSYLSNIKKQEKQIAKKFLEIQNNLNIPQSNARFIKSSLGSYLEIQSELDAVKRDLKRIVDPIKYSTKLKNIKKDWDSYLETNKKIAERLSSSITIPKSIGNIEELQKIQQNIVKENKNILNLWKDGHLSKISGELTIDEEEVKIEKKVNFILDKIRGGIEKHGIYSFWKSKTKGKLKNKPEDIAQALFSVSLCMLSFESGINFIFDEQVQIGVGKMDVKLTFYDGNKFREVIVEIKIIDNENESEKGIDQLFEYMRLKDVDFGVRLIFNTTQKKLSENTYNNKGRSVQDFIVNINPKNPSNL